MLFYFYELLNENAVPGIGELRRQVVLARTPFHARTLASRSCGTEGNQVWYLEHLVTCEQLEGARAQEALREYTSLEQSRVLYQEEAC